MGRLVIIPTPIGNLEDITLRSIRMLKECQVIYAEDTLARGKHVILNMAEEILDVIEVLPRRPMCA